MARDAPEARADVRDTLIAAALELGFQRAGIASATLPDDERARLERWLARGDHGTMDYMARDPLVRADVARAILPGARSVLMVALAYPPELDARPAGAGRARVSCYARGRDYHAVLRERLDALVARVGDLLPGARARRFVDTAPVLERAYARAAGLGFYGKNTCVIDRELGSYFFLGGIAIDRELAADAPDEIGSCGTCTRCIEACPTGAIKEPFRLDARRCISYLTIEHRGAFDEELRPLVGDWVFGCDVCQAVCPWNEKFAPEGDRALAARAELDRPILLELYRRARASWKSLARDSAIERARKRGMLRNLATAMGNDLAHGSSPDHASALRELAEHEDLGVRDHARWALARAGRKSSNLP